MLNPGWWIALAATLAFHAAVAATAPQPNDDRARDLLQSFTFGASAPGCSAAYAEHGHLIWSGAIGEADIEHAAPIDAATMFNVGSISKPITGLVVMLLERDGRLTLDDSIRKYIPTLPATYEPVRIRHLLSHTSGVRDWQDLLLIMGPFRRDDELRGSDVMAALRAQRGLNFHPGTRVQYSNSNYVLLGELVHAVSGMSLADFSRSRIFEPLGMHHTRIVDDHTALIPGVAIAYQKDDTPAGWELVPRTWDLVGPSDLYTTAADLVTFIDASRSAPWDALFSRMETIATLDDGRPAADDADRFAGFGFWIRKHDGKTLIGHDGVTEGTRAAAFQIRDDFRSAVVVCNHNQIDAETAAMRLLDVFTNGGWSAALDTTPPPPDAAPARPSDSHFAGTYQQSQTRIPYRISPTENGLSWGMSRRPLQLLRDGSYMLPSAPSMRVRFEESRGVAHMLLLNGGSREIEPYERISDDWQYVPSAADIAAVAGCYASPELGVGAELRAGKEGSLELVDSRGRTRKYDAALRDLWRGGFDTLEFERSANDAVTGFARSTEIAWRVEYERRSCAGAPPAAP